RTMVNMTTINIAGRLTMEPVRTKKPLLKRQGLICIVAGKTMPTFARTFWKYPDQPVATVALPTAYSSTRSQPMIQANSSPSVAYAYVYAEPATGTIDANSA